MDLEITNIPERVEEIFEAGRLRKSDHILIETRVSEGAAAEEPVPQGKDWRRADTDEKREELADRAWAASILRVGAADAWAIFQIKISEITERHVSNRRLRNQNRPAWLTQNILRGLYDRTSNN